MVNVSNAQYINLEKYTVGQKVEILPGQAIFELKRYNNHTVVRHVALANLDRARLFEVGTDSIPVYDWPLKSPLSNNTSVRTIKLDHNVVKFGDTNNLRQNTNFDPAQILLEAREILLQTSVDSKKKIPKKLYKIHPHRKHSQEEAFPFVGSCAGFIEHCYQISNIDIVHDEVPHCDTLPLVTEDELLKWLGESGPSKSRKKTLQARLLRLAGNAPYHILFPGYQLVAFLTNSTFPYKVSNFEDAFWK